MTNAASAPIDPEAWCDLLALGGEDAGAMVQELITMYLEDGEVLMEAILNNQAAGDSGALARSAHALRSPSATLGALHLAKLCRDVELACGDGPGAPPADDLIEALVSESQRVFSALRQQLKNP